MSKFIGILLLLLFFPVFLSAQERLRPPDLIKCDRNQLTSFSGKVEKFERTKEKVFLGLQTDQGAKDFTIEKTEKQGAMKYFLINGEKFQKGDWKRILEEKKVREGVTVIVWVCETEKNPYFDWRLPEEAPAGVD